MSFVRPEAARAILRWRAVILSALVVLGGLWWAWASVGPIAWIGWVIAALGVGGILSALQRMRFHSGREGPGVVQVDEGAIAYFGPLTGGVVARSEITALALDRGMKPPHWVLSQPGQPDLMIPLTAAGADALFDSFASLPGIRTERMLTEMRRGGRDRVAIWQRAPSRQHALLH
ncbi:hypothetical protein D6850_15905 [Roseovarius spongiae]|uniref:Uncharacterized protein n=1 Tax=Roseovarius spongiae TaxID=2320272 RepID=A0A3A8B233_9RHOB|nr:hypothetical protein [Roseovarius spongiae]RKF12986.1 hypothetical protein D6850_15905 [Roseovarius spongiae]